VQSEKFESWKKKKECAIEEKICENYLSVEILTSVHVKNIFIRPKFGLTPNETQKHICT
jgi:hypothetical protein